jgi:hypothetical protein
VARDDSTIPQLTLERYRLGELPPDRMQEIAYRAAIDPDVRARLGALAQSDAVLAEALEAGSVAARVAGRRGPEKAASRPFWQSPAWLSLAAAAALVVAIGVPAITTTSGPTPPTAGDAAGSGPDRVKGDAASLLVYRRAGSASEALRDGDSARAGDLVRVAYRAASPRYGVIVSLDGRGVVTRHLPVVGDAAVRLQPGELTPLANAYELDDAPRWEQFFLITSETPFEVERVLDAARTAATTAGRDAPAALPLASSFEQSSFLLRKSF